MGYYRENDTNHDTGDRINDERTDYMEETAAETAPIGNDAGRSGDRIDEDRRGEEREGTGYGILALVLSILAFFFLPIVMGAAGIIIGFIARARGASTWGGWAIGVGIAAIVISLFAAPFL